MRLAALVALALALAGTAGAAGGRRPAFLVQPTSIEREPAGTLLVVENNPGRILRLDPANGRISVVASGLVQPYAIVRAPSGAVYFSAGSTIRRLGGGVVARNAAQIGPIALGRDGTLYYATATGGVFRVGGGRLVPHEPISSPHGLAVAADGSLLVSDTGGDRIVRIRRGRASTFADAVSPRGLDVAADGSVYVVDPVSRRIAHLSSSGRHLGWLGPPLPGDPYDVQAGPAASAYVLESGPVGDIRLIRRDGTVRVL